MPYFPEKHVLFIHIPKTGGTTIEYGLVEKKGNKPPSLYGNPSIRAYSGKGNRILPDPELQKVSLQHQTYRTLYQYSKLLNIPFDDKLKILSVVRNPYDRIVSDLFWHKLININTPPNMVFQTIKQYIYKTTYDNHNLPQYQFIIDDSGNLIPNLTLMKMETLDEDLERYGYGYCKMQPRVNVNQQHKNKTFRYHHYLNRDSLEWIHRVYRTDFAMFDYPMKPTDRIDIVVFISDASNVQELEMLAKQFAFLPNDETIQNVFVCHSSIPASNTNDWSKNFLLHYPETYSDKLRLHNVPHNMSGFEMHQWAVDWIQSDIYIILDKDHYFT